MHFEICRERLIRLNIYPSTFGSGGFVEVSASENDSSSALCQVDGRFFADSRIGSGDDDRFAHQFVGALAIFHRQK
jgi:hypothetical protein